MTLTTTRGFAKIGVIGLLGAPPGMVKSTNAVGEESKIVDRQGGMVHCHYLGPASRRPETLRARFERLLNDWKRDTAFTSSLDEMYSHPAYGEIIAMGLPAVPLILKELQTDPEWWFGSLESITGENPVSPTEAGDLEKMTASWLRWAKSHKSL